MIAQSAPMAVGDYCTAMVERSIVVNKEYQRNPGIWKREARSFFIESILLQYPIPKIFLYSKVDLATRRSVKEIVDGQQRSMALLDFYNNGFRLSKNVDTPELRQLNYDGLSDEWKEKFLSYSLPIDQFIGVQETEVREAFRRMNLNNVPLNEEEQRNAEFQGELKWFIHELATDYKDAFFEAGVFSRRDFIRMADYRLFAELLYAIDIGIETTKGAQLRALCRKYDKEFLEAQRYSAIVQDALNRALEARGYQGTRIFRPVAFYGLILAHAGLQNPELRLNVQVRPTIESIDEQLTGQITLQRLADALENPGEARELSEFVRSCETKTNVAAS